MDHAGDERVRQLDDETEVSDVHDGGAEDLRIALLELLFEKLKLLQADRFDLGVGGVSLRVGNVLGDRFDLSDVDL